MTGTYLLLSRVHEEAPTAEVFWLLVLVVVAVYLLGRMVLRHEKEQKELRELRDKIERATARMKESSLCPTCGAQGDWVPTVGMVEAGLARIIGEEIRCKSRRFVCPNGCAVEFGERVEGGRSHG